MKFKIHARIRRSARAEAGHTVPKSSIAAPPEKPLPSVARMGVNYGRALIKEGVARLRREPPPASEEQALRKRICEGTDTEPRCDEYRPSDGRCSRCGCWRDDKVAWHSSRCPLGKW